MEVQQAEELPDLVSLVEVPEWKGILLDLVRSERMNPWDIDLVLLAQKYLERIRSMQSNNLYVPANALLACAILLNMKADVLRQYFREEEEQAPEFVEDFVDDFALALDVPEDPAGDASEESSGTTPEPPEVLPPARITARRVSLEELLAAMERVMKAKKRVPRQNAVNIEPFEEFFEDLEQEDVDRIIAETYERIKASADSEGLTTLSRIVPSNRAEDIVRTFLPVLYLANDGKINVWQEEPFAEIFIAVREEDGAPGPEKDS